MNKNALILVLILVSSVPYGCRNERAVNEVETSTIAPAKPPADAPDTEAVATQTTEIGEERSPNEGGALTEPSPVPGESVTAAPGASPSP